jgi:ribose transport system ATP-binding protein
MSDVSKPALTIRGLSKSFGPTTALADFDLDLAAGEIHILVGANGSGKSTLIKILSGFHTPDTGSVRVGGEPLDFAAPGHSYRLGCRFVHQDLGLVASESVLDNLFFGVGYPRRAGAVSRRRAAARARDSLERVGLDLDLRATVSSVGSAERTGLAVARAIQSDAAHPARLLVLDEPTATLPVDEVERLLGIVRRAADGGVAVLFVTHHLDEVFEIGSSVTVLRDGQVTGRSRIDAIDRRSLVVMLTGTEVADVEKKEAAPRPADDTRPALAVSHLAGRQLSDVSFAAAPGKIIGFAGLAGSGRETVLGTIFGALPRAGGAVSAAGRPVPSGDPRAAIARGLGFLPADRKAESGVMTLTATENVMMANVTSSWRWFGLAGSRDRAEARRWFDELAVHPRGKTGQDLSAFSGGNQQKILFAKWLRCQPDVLLLDEPTQGVDVGARAELHRRILGLAEQGAAVLVSSSDPDELESLCSRVYVLRRGLVSDELTGADVTASAIVHRMMAEATDPVPGRTEEHHAD